MYTKNLPCRSFHLSLRHSVCLCKDELSFKQPYHKIPLTDAIRYLSGVTKMSQPHGFRRHLGCPGGVNLKLLNSLNQTF